MLGAMLSQPRCGIAAPVSKPRAMRVSSLRISRHHAYVVCAKGKGFAKQAPTKPATQQKKKSKSTQKQPEVKPQPVWEPPRSPPPADFIAPPSTAAAAAGPSPADAVDDDFASRLQALKVEAKAKAQEKKAAATAAPVEPAAPLYAAPPSIKETILERMNEDIADPALRKADIGPGRVGIAAGAILLVGVLAVTSVGLGGEGKRFSGLRPARPPPDELGQAMLTTRVTQLEEKLRGTPEDTEALAALATTYGDLYKWDAAASTLEKLLKLSPKDGEAWRQYGDINLLALQSRKAVKGYEQSLTLLPDDPLSFTGLVNAYIADTKYQKAIDLTSDTRTRLAAAAAAAAAAPSSASTATEAPAPAASAGAEAVGGSSSEGRERAEGAAAPAASSSGAGSSERPSLAGKGRSKRLVGGSKKRAGIDPVEVELLQAKTYIAWRGHDNDALAVYDQAIKSFPEDYRLYQAKGLFLKERGRKADAERMFLQARYYAPSSMQQALVEMQKGPSPSVDPAAIPGS